MHKNIKVFFLLLFIVTSFLSPFLKIEAVGEYKDLEAGTYTATIENFANSGKTQTFQMVLIPDINGYLYLDREKTNIPIKDYSGDKDYLPDELTYKNANGKEVTFDLRSTSRIDNTSGAIKVDGQGKITSPTVIKTAVPSATTPPPNSNIGSYTFLAPLPFFGGTSINIAEGGLAGYLDGLYKAGVAVATGLALIMIVAGGLEYASAGSVGGKEGGKSKIKNALIGLLLALTSFIILQQINPGLIRNDLAVDATKAVGGITGQTVDLVDYTNTTLGNLPYTQGILNDSLYNGTQGIPGVVPINTSGSKIRPRAIPNVNWSAYALDLIKRSRLPQTNPTDARSYFTDGRVTAEGWLYIVGGIIEKESSFNPNTTYQEPGGSRGPGTLSVGLMQMSTPDPEARRKGYTNDDLKDPYKNLEVGIGRLEALILKDNCITCWSGPTGWKGASAYWSVLRP